MKKSTKRMIAALLASMLLSLTACSGQDAQSSQTSGGTQNTSTASSVQDTETIYQVALLQSLTQGYYDGIIKVSELKEHGDTGIGTFEGVNGEMIVIDGKVYQALGDGSVKEAADDETVPFSNVTFFDSDVSVDLKDIKDMASFKSELDKTVAEKGKNMFYMVKVSGTFEKMYVRSEIKQEKPYKSLDKALETDQREFNYENIAGTVVGLYCPDYMGGLNAAGWHFHFISDDRTKGGHILELNFKEAKAELDITPSFDMALSDNGDFQGMELAKDVNDAIKKVETEAQTGDKTSTDTSASALSLWTDSAPLKSQLTDYIKAVTDESSADFIPVENRIAVFDMDGTLCCETDPGYFDHKLLYHRVMEDPDYKDKASKEEKETAAIIKTYFETGEYPSGLDVKHGKAVATAFKGMTIDEFDAYVKAYRDQPMESYEGMTNGQAFYKPMLEVVDYLIANDFKVYIVSGTDRLITRGLAEGTVNIPLSQMIGSDESLVATGQGDTDSLDYTFGKDDKVVTGGEFLIKNLKTNKVTVIEQEIGVQPVLAFGNSGGDSAMANFTINNNKYKSAAYMLCCDDTERENGNVEKADKMRKTCEENGYTAISMKDDWTTIYGDGVTYKGAEKTEETQSSQE